MFYHMKQTILSVIWMSFLNEWNNHKLQWEIFNTYILIYNLIKMWKYKKNGFSF